MLPLAFPSLFSLLFAHHLLFPCPHHCQHTRKILLQPMILKVCIYKTFHLLKICLLKYLHCCMDTKGNHGKQYLLFKCHSSFLLQQNLSNSEALQLEEEKKKQKPKTRHLLIEKINQDFFFFLNECSWAIQVLAYQRPNTYLIRNGIRPLSILA